MPKFELTEELVVIAQLFHTASLQMTKCYPRVNPLAHWSTILSFPAHQTSSSTWNQNIPLNSWKWVTHSLSRKHETNSRPVTTLVFHPVTPVRGTAFPYGSCPKFVTELHLHSRKIIQSGGCCKLSDQWLQEVQPQGHCGTVVQPGLTWHSHFSSNNNSDSCTLSLHQPVPSPSSVCQCHLNFGQTISTLAFHWRTLSRPRKKNI